jgi:hypothetical protein
MKNKNSKCLIFEEFSMKDTFNKKDLSRVLKSVLIIEGKIGELRFRQKEFKAIDLSLDNKAIEKLYDSFGVKTPDEFVDFIKSLY